jgi:hypothetical protein
MRNYKKYSRVLVHRLTRRLTPFSEVIDASPVIDKNIFFVENYPMKTEKCTRQFE